ncbi:bifunctional folylpolyglutamate synthase/dihydrofolate synthase [Carboxylicivirga linearis]|uniref:Dihydrofolate synthase/folylpolyglutamate synthase n=1 Tax=Carboxylicivirga linearis TaxID=1628157 RepID=A0ABS5JY11_9BACT|nr:folylpolyglutamate synthase/dihydrofolate synthase family protein [Carboxylicivirga linearis]MBS2099765.1 bifunctional folylpolyglutamate synthase/dihydrofolate synthase [Carboxylicivirga linearis]
MKSYQETLNYLFSQLPMYQRVGQAAYKADLHTTLELDKYFNHPHKNYKTIHVAGTNGKGSVSHCLASVLQQAGYKTGLYTSPHLVDFRERIKVNGEMISEQAVIDFVENHQDIINTLEPSFFEMTVAMAFEYFKNEKVDIAIIEVGMGGRLDSTNIISPELSVITNIGLDHTTFLGDTLPKVAAEKGGIIKENIPVIIGQTQEETSPIFIELAKSKSTPITFADQKLEAPYSTFSIDEKQIFQISENGQIKYPNLKLDLLGNYQRKNIVTALCTIESLQQKGFPISIDDIYKGLQNVVSNTGLLGRWQTIGYNPRIVCDTGHNAEGIKLIVEQIKNTAYKTLHFIIGMVDDKDHAKVLSQLPKDAIYYFTKAAIPRSIASEKLQIMAKDHQLEGDCYPTPHEALEKAKKIADANDLIFIGGSTFIVADTLENIQ